MIEVYADAEALARAAAGYIARCAADDIAARGEFVIALAGGSTPKRTYELLAAKPFRDSVAWNKVHVYWGDERCVPPDDERSNERMARIALLDHVDVDELHVHPIRCARSPVDAAREYDQLMRRSLAHRDMPFDLVVLGMGDDGHTAGLFPGSFALDESFQCTAVVRKHGEDIDRITMTLPLLNSARRAMFIVSGASKSQMLHEVVDERNRAAPEMNAARLPASRIAPSGSEPVWMVDADANGHR